MILGWNIPTLKNMFSTILISTKASCTQLQKLKINHVYLLHIAMHATYADGVVIFLKLMVVFDCKHWVCKHSLYNQWLYSFNTRNLLFILFKLCLMYYLENINLKKQSIYFLNPYKPVVNSTIYCNSNQNSFWTL